MKEISKYQYLYFSPLSLFSEDVSEPASQTMDRSSSPDEDDEGSIVDMLLADVRSGFASRKFNDGNFSVTKVTKVNLNTNDIAKAVSSGIGGVIGNENTVEASFVRGAPGRNSQRSKRQDGSSADNSVEDASSPSPDSLGQRRNRRSYASEDDNSLIDFLIDAQDSQNTESQKPEANFERYASLRRRRQERKEKRHGLDLIDQERERAPSPSVTDSKASPHVSLSADSASIQMRLHDVGQNSPSGDRPKSQNEADVKGSRALRRTRSWLDRPSVEKANQEKAEKDSSDALISRIKQRLGRKEGGRSTPPIPEEMSRNSQRSNSASPSPSSRWRSGISVGNEIATSPLDPITEKSPTLNDFAPETYIRATEKTRDRVNRFRSSLDPAEVNRALQDLDDADSSTTRSKDDSDVSSPSVMVSVRKQISSGMGTNIDHILKTIEDTGRQIDTVGVSGPMQRTPETPLKSSATLKPSTVAVVAHVTAQNRPITPISEIELKKKRDMRKKRSTLSMEDVKAAMKLGDPVSNIQDDSNQSDVATLNTVSMSKTPPTPRRHSSSSEKSDGEASPGRGSAHVSSKEMSKAAKLAAKKKFRDARFGASTASETSDTDRAKSNVESESVDQALKEMATKGSMSRSKSCDEHVVKKTQDVSGEDFESNTILRNSGSAPDTSKERKAVMRKSNSRLSMDGRRNGLYIPSDESDTELKPEDLGNRRSSKSDSPKSFSRLSLKSTNTSTETLHNDVESSPEQKRKSSSSSHQRQHLISRDDTYANTSMGSAGPGSPNSIVIPTLPQRPTSACAMDAESSPLRRTYSLMDRSKVFDEESDSPLAAVAKWRLKRERKRLSVYDNVAENETGLSSSSPSNQEISHPASANHHAIHLKSETSDLKNEVGSRSSYASSYASSNERDEGFESASGTLSQRTSMSSTLEAEIYGTPTLSRRAENMKLKSAVESPLSVEKPVISNTSSNNAVMARLSEEANRKERTENWTEQTVRVSTISNASKDPSSDTSTEYSALSPDSGHSTSKEDIWSDEAPPTASSNRTSSPVKQKESAAVSGTKLSSSSSKSGTSGEKTTATKSVPSYMRPTSASVSARDSPNRTSVKERELPPTIKRDSGVRASMRAETATASFQRGTVHRTSVRGPRSSVRLSTGGATTPSSVTSNTTTARSDLRPSSSMGRPRADSNVSVSSNASSTSNASSSLATSNKKRLSHTASAGPSASINRPTTPSLRPTTPSAGRSTTSTTRSSAPPSVRSPTSSTINKTTSHTLSPTAPSSNKTSAPARSTISPAPAQPTGSSVLKRTQSMRVTTTRTSVTAETASSVARRQISTTNSEPRSTTPSHDIRRSTTPLPHEGSRSTTPLSHERPRSTTPMDGRSTPRRSSFMAPTAASKAKVDEQTPSAPPRTRSLTTSSSGTLTRHASLRLPKKSSPSALTSKDLAGNGRKSPATVESPLHPKEHHQSLSTVTEQVADEDKEEEMSKKSPSLLKRIGLTKSKVSPGAANTKALKQTSTSVRK